jgi:hypothetical protein
MSARPSESGCGAQSLSQPGIVRNNTGLRDGRASHTQLLSLCPPEAIARERASVGIRVEGEKVKPCDPSPSGSLRDVDRWTEIHGAPWPAAR